MRIATNISTAMVKEWTIAQAIAELLQNALDARKAGADMSITREGSILTIADTGPGLSKRHLALGISEKGPEAAGQFGLGMKEAWLVLAREGRAVQTITKGMTITPTIADVGLEVPCLVMNIVGNDLGSGTFHKVECTPDEETEAKAHFSEWQTVNWVDQDKGLSIPGGNVYVNGVLCGTVKDAVFSYHLTGEKAQKLNNSDRHAIDMTAFSSLAEGLFHECNRATADKLLPYLTTDQSCWEQNLWPGWLASVPWGKAIADAWPGRVVITGGTDNIDRMRYLGYNPKQICAHWHWPVAALCTPLQEAQAALAKQARVDADLTHREAEILRAALDRMARHGVKIDPACVHVARTLNMDSGTACDGLRIGNEIWLAASVLKTARTAIPILVHEFAHLESGADDCSAEFEAALLDIGMKLAFGGD